MGRAAPCRDGDETGALDHAEDLTALRLAWGTPGKSAAVAPGGRPRAGTGPGTC